MKKLIFVISFIVLFVFIFGFSSPYVKAVTLDELQAQIIKLQAQIVELKRLLTEIQFKEAQDREETEVFAPGRLLVRFKDNVSENEQKAFLEGQGFKIEKEIKQIKVKIISVPQKTEESLAQALSKNTNIAWVEPDYAVEAIFVPDDTFYPSQWALPKIQATDAWDTATGATTTKIAILDTGIDMAHADLASKIASAINFSDSPNSHNDIDGHGTHCAGIAAATTNNHRGIAGVCPDCSLMNVKVLNDTGSGYFSWVADGILWATDHDAAVISMSLGGSSPSSIAEDAINYAWDNGVLVVSAAGNNGSSAPFYPAYYVNSMAVAATDEDDAKPSWSNYGDWVDVAAPGNVIFSTIPYGYANMSGTSMAAPHVSGLAGLLVSITADKNDNGFINDEIRLIIEGTTDAIDWGSQPIANGRINAFSAVNATIDDLSRFLLGVITGTGSGTVNVNPPGINYSSTFIRHYENGTLVTLTATPDANSVFSGWSEECIGTGVCTIEMNFPKSVTATFDMTGIIDCSQEYGTQYWCSDYEGWQTECQGEGEVKDLPEGTFCEDELGEQYDKCVTCVPQETFSLSVESTPLTNIPIIGEPTEYTGRTNYIREDILVGTNISLTAPTTYASYAFIGWSGCDVESGPGAEAGPSPICEVTMDSNRTVTANYVFYNPILYVSRAGTGSGTVTSSPSGINCGFTCSAPYDYNTSVTLNVAPDTDSTFVGWFGACTGIGPCTISMTSNKFVTAIFNVSETTYNLYVNSYPTGIPIIGDPTEYTGRTNYIREDILSGTNISLTALNYGDYVFMGWSGCVNPAPGAAAGPNPVCEITMDSDHTVIANYGLYHRLSVAKAGAGSGTVTSDPYGINCGSACSLLYKHYTSVTLTATPDPGSTFIGWSGSCIGIEPCTILMSIDRSVTATFETPSVCTDSDGGKDYYVKGTVTYGDTVNTDTCSSSGYLFEQYCLNDEPVQGTYWCPDGCQDGVCISAPPSTTLIYPNGGEEWKIGNTYHIAWQTSGLLSSASVQIGLRDTRYDPNLGSGEATIINTTNDGSYNWEIPETIEAMTLGAGNVYKIIVYVDEGGLNKHDLSDSNFSIIEASTPPPEEILVPGYNFYVKTSDTGTGNWSFAKSSCEALGSGWSLPTMDQLRILYQKRDEIGGFKDQAYWSLESGKYIHFSNGFESSMSPAMTFPAFRCVRGTGTTRLDYMGSQLASLGNTLFKLSELVRGLLGR